MAEKAGPEDYLGRFREIISDPLNLLIERDHRAGVVEGQLVHLHNGLRVPIAGPGAYYGKFSEILILNRGVHEPLEEYIFQELLRTLTTEPTMLELGAYWGHYSMWLKDARPQGRVFLVEPNKDFLAAGVANFHLNHLEGEFISASVQKDQFQVDAFLKERQFDHIDILRADIQGFEVEMLDGSENALQNLKIGYVFVSTHSDALHHEVLERLSRFGYRIEASSNFDVETTSFDGLVFASNPRRDRILKEYVPLGRKQILTTSCRDSISRLSRMVSQ